ncbi:hypothetical protein ZWY2020_043855 [Hordeum vulgare]|uniref:Uncharacterized protein n=1 Tax=Hordeum vulgare subsp. vulgare TaxID=112509 RepID=A0A8I7B3P2_HORVV|nr:hypothetical protein ZWY2020_043855 [Hordeum vulgare]
MDSSIGFAGDGNDGDVGTVLARYSLDVSAGCGGRRSTLLDEYERLAFEAQLKSAILRRCYSEPSPARFVDPAADAAAAPALAGTEREVRREDPAAGSGRSSWRLHEVVARWLESLKPVFCWLWSVLERRRWKEQDAPRGPPATLPRVQLLDYLC